MFSFFFFNDTATTEIYTLSLHDALPIWLSGQSFIPERTLWAYREDVNRWETRAPLPVPRGASGAAAVGGRLVVVGGWGAGRRLVDSTAIYDPAANGWRNAAPIPTLPDHLPPPPIPGTVAAIAR